MGEVLPLPQEKATPGKAKRREDAKILAATDTQRNHYEQRRTD